MPRVPRLPAAGPAAVLALLLVAGCSGSGSDAAPERTITVFAAASLNRAFSGMARSFEQNHPGLRVAVSYAGSQALAAQVREGAPADVLATADLATATSLGSALSTAPVVFAHNQLTIISRADGRAFATLQQLAEPGVRVVLGGPTVPVGKASAAALKQAGVRLTPVSLEDAVTGVVTKVSLGEADAGIAYVTDVVGNDSLQGVPVAGTRTDLAIAPIAGIDDPDDADAFIGFVRSETGRTIMESWGFT